MLKNFKNPLLGVTLDSSLLIGGATVFAGADPSQTQERAPVNPLISRAHDFHDPDDQWDAIRQLWGSPLGGYKVADHLAVRPVVLQLAEEPHNPHYWNAVITLFSSFGVHAAEDQAIGRAILLTTARNAADPHQEDAIYSLWRTDGENFWLDAEDRAAIIPLCMEIINNPHNSQFVQ